MVHHHLMILHTMQILSMFNEYDASKIESGTCKIPQSSTKYYAQLRNTIVVLQAYPCYAIKEIAGNVSSLYRYTAIISPGDALTDLGLSKYYGMYNGCRIYLSIDETISATSVYRDYNNPIICKFWYIKDNSTYNDDMNNIDHWVNK